MGAQHPAPLREANTPEDFFEPNRLGSPPRSRPTPPESCQRVAGEIATGAAGDVHPVDECGVVTLAGIEGVPQVDERSAGGEPGQAA